MQPAGQEHITLAQNAQNAIFNDKFSQIAWTSLFIKIIFSNERECAQSIGQTH